MLKNAQNLSKIGLELHKNSSCRILGSIHYTKVVQIIKCTCTFFIDIFQQTHRYIGISL